MTFASARPASPEDAAPPVEPAFAAQLAAERTRLLYQGSLLPTLFMLINGLVCSWLLWSPRHYVLVSIWLVWLMLLAALRVIQVAAFDSAMPARQSDPRWLRRFLLGAGLSGLTLAAGAIALTPVNSFIQQAWLFGLLGAAALSASIAYAVSLPAFLTFTLPCLLPPVGYLLLWGDEHQRGWGWLGLMLLVSLAIVAWQVNRLIERNLLRRFQNQALIERLQAERIHGEQLNQELAEEVQHRRAVEDTLRETHAELEVRVAERSQALDHANQALSKSEERLALALEASELGLWDWNLQTDEVHHSELKRLFGLDESSVSLMLKDLRPRLHPDDMPLLKKTLTNHLKGRTTDYRVEYRVRHEDGRWLWVEDHGRAVERGPRGRVLRMIGTRADISKRKAWQQQLSLAATVFEAMSEGIVVLDAAFGVLAVNKAFTAITGYSEADAMGFNLIELPCSHDARRQFQAICQALEERGGWQGELVETRKNGELYPQWMQLSVVRDRLDNISHIVGFFSDLSGRRASEERMRFLSHYDELTGLANRVLFRERLQEAALRATQRGRALALLHIDIDRFKLINDSLGHDTADQVLKEMARRISNALPEADTIARLAGDEFAVLFDAYANLSSLARVTSRLLGKLRAPLLINGHELIIGASIGISLLPDNARVATDLVAQANTAMQHAKHLGGDTFQFFTESQRASTLERLQLENQLRKAIDEQQLEVFYQPKLHVASGRLESAEALVRWRHPTRGLVLPGEFIPLAEETGLIGAIGEFVLRQACWQAQQWQRHGLAPVRVSVNLSVHQLRQGKLVSLVRQVLDDTGLAARCLELELTESQLLDSIEHISQTFQQLREIGVKLAIDDFGTGYSSLSYLKRLPVDYVKIDQAFVRGLDEAREDVVITQAIIAMAHSLGLQVVAEGVETQGQLEILKEQGCDEIQGYLISRPVAAHEMAQLLIRDQRGWSVES
jgi:diguanylate cyclase (GGDEF)-like protein/PAS domain S-box-containing protein